MESGQASSWCSIVPEYLLHNIAENEEASSELREAAKNTIEEGRDLLDKSVISNNITGTINGKTISVTFNGKPPPARGVERSVWNANGSYDLPGTAWSENHGQSMRRKNRSTVSCKVSTISSKKLSTGSSSITMETSYT